MTPITLTAYAARRGVSVKAVSKAVAAGRLDKSVVRDHHGAPKISDPELADREWASNTRAPIDRQPRIFEPPASEQATGRDSIPDLNTSRALRAAASARRESALAVLAELDVAQRRGEMVAVDEARADMIDKFTVVKTRILGVPARVAQRMPHVAA